MEVHAMGGLAAFGASIVVAAQASSATREHSSHER
jgi:hypothetical protein